MKYEIYFLLPDGDIDLIALSCQNIEDGLVSDVHVVLHGEEVNEAVEYEVKDPKVKLRKCIVQDLVVDISFNHLGGLSTLCFLEKKHLNIIDPLKENNNLGRSVNKGIHEKRHCRRREPQWQTGGNVLDEIVATHMSKGLQEREGFK
ncbi:hypothetical protein JHK82_043616 [Glycine max]|nr:hypothetical protein JHK86_043503 [Glycine max]KAG4957783.1 hypothetical protein JHK85_044163 [Glycine max]KAG5106646.1 hypothetical protein JHK82_043616 [Glycine max]